jgi:hypothetical protein
MAPCRVGVGGRQAARVEGSTKVGVVGRSVLSTVVRVWMCPMRKKEPRRPAVPPSPRGTARGMQDGRSQARGPGWFWLLASFAGSEGDGEGGRVRASRDG